MCSLRHEDGWSDVSTIQGPLCTERQIVVSLYLHIVVESQGDTLVRSVKKLQKQKICFTAHSSQFTCLQTIKVMISQQEELSLKTTMSNQESFLLQICNITMYFKKLFYRLRYYIISLWCIVDLYRNIHYAVDNNKPTVINQRQEEPLIVEEKINTRVNTPRQP